MGDWETSEQLSDATSQWSAHSTPSAPSGNWWWHRHFHVPVVVWIVASVLGGAAIGDVVEPDRKATETPTTIEVSSEPMSAMACDTDNGADADVDVDVERASFAAGPATDYGDVTDADGNPVSCD
jgi:hypothetical protein